MTSITYAVPRSTINRFPKGVGYYKLNEKTEIPEPILGAASRRTRSRISGNKFHQSETPITRMQDEASIFGERNNPRSKQQSFMERLRKFHHEHPRVDQGIAIASCLTLAATLATVSGIAVDALAHMTNRKNDKVGLVVGAFVGLFTALSQIGSLHGVGRRLDIALGARGMRQGDNTASANATRSLLERENAIFLHATLRTNKSMKAVPQNQVEIYETDVRKAINDSIIRNEWDKSIWKHFMVQSKTASANRPTGEEWKEAYQATADVPHCDIKKGYWYRARFTSASEVLERDMHLPYQPSFHQAKTLLDLRDKPLVSKDFEIPENLKISAEERAQLNGLKDSLNIKSYEQRLDDKIEELLKNGEFLEEDAETGERVLLDKSTITSLKQDIANKIKLYHKAATPEEKETAQQNLVNFLNRSKQNPYLARTWLRIDEFTKVLPLLLTGLRPASMHTFVVNLVDSTLNGIEPAMDASAQARNTGTSLGMYIPMVMIAAVITVLGLGMSSNSSGPMPGAVPVAEGGKKGLGAAANANNAAPTGIGGPVCVAPLVESAVRGHAKGVNLRDLLNQAQNGQTTQTSIQSTIPAPPPAYLSPFATVPSGVSVSV